MEDPTTIAMIDRWIADYYSHLVWGQFEKDGSVLCNWVRDYICAQKETSDHLIVLDDKEGTLTPEMNPRLLIDFMYKISYGERLFEDCDESGRTLLEEAIEILDDILSADKLYNHLDRSSIWHMKMLLRQQAVLVCCKNKKFGLANEVFGREWRYYKNEDEVEVRQNILNVIEQQNSTHEYLELMPYSSLIDGTRIFLRTIFSLLKTPFLVTAAQSVLSSYGSIMQKYSFLKSQNLSDDNKHASNPSIKAPGNHKSTPSYNMKPNQTEHITCIETKTILNSEQISHSEVTVSAVNHGSLQMNSVETVAEGCKDVGKSAGKFQAVSEISEMSDNEQDSPNDTFNVKRKCKDVVPKCSDWESELSSAVLLSPESKSRKFWQPIEEERLYLGTQKYGVGQWKKVADFLGSGRSNVDVKDKWRTMIKQGKVKKYEKQFGPIVT